MEKTYLNPSYTPMREDLGPLRFHAERLIKMSGNYSIFKLGSSYDVVSGGVLVHQVTSLMEAENYCILSQSSTAA